MPTTLTSSHRARPGSLRWAALVAFLLLGVGELVPDAWADLTLAGKGKTRYRIVLPTNAPPAELYAAEELQRYLESLSGARLPIVADTEPEKAREILIGDNLHLGRLNLQLDRSTLGSDGFILRTERDYLILVGGQPRGVLNAVYTLLEEQFGVRWFTPELESVPKLNAVRVPKLKRTVVPALEYREVFWTEMMRNGDFAARHRLNGPHHKLTDKHGGPAVVYYPFVHSFDALIPPDLFKEHPEYFPLIDGQRKDGYVQRCLTNPDVLKIATDRVKQWIKEHPEATIISVSQNDTFNYCTCEKCKALDDAEGSPAATLLQFVNAIAEAIEPEHPKVRIDTLAYQYTRKPPKTIRPRKNVIVRLCSIECCFAHPLETCPTRENRRFREDIMAWEPVAPLLYIWDYTPNFAHYQQIFPNFDALQPNVQFFVKHGVKGLFEQGNYSGGGGGEMGPLRAYLLAKLLWNPDTDLKRHTDEFTRAYYGRSADKIKAYLDVTHAPVRGKDCHAHIFDSPKSCHLTDDVLKEGERLLDEAEQAADDDTIRFRVQVARLPVWYGKLASGRVAGDERKELARQFVALARKAGISNISEGKALDVWAKEMGVE
jgi:hypothetical protein